jgi:hypothetical protein
MCRLQRRQVWWSPLSSERMPSIRHDARQSHSFFNVYSTSSPLLLRFRSGKTHQPSFLVVRESEESTDTHGAGLASSVLTIANQGTVEDISWTSLRLSRSSLVPSSGSSVQHKSSTTHCTGIHSLPNKHYTLIHYTDCIIKRNAHTYTYISYMYCAST